MGTDSSVGAGATSPREGLLSTLRAKIVAATGVLVVLPALVNAGYDVYATAAKLPRSQSERENAELFQKYFKKAPLVVNALPIRTPPGGVMEVRFSVYEEGDIHVEFGQRSQWFRLKPTSSQAAAPLSMVMSAAVAQTVQTRPSPQAPSAAVPSMRQIERLEAGKLVRVRELPEGKAEEVQYDLRTGAILSRRNVDIDTLRRTESAIRVPITTRLRELQL